MDLTLKKRKPLLSACAIIVLATACLASYVPCEPCDHKALSVCPPVPVGCQAVKEPGCGCCMSCALREGHTCGVYTGTCAAGLRCLPLAGEEKPLYALLHGKGMCMNEKVHKLARDDVLGPVTNDRIHHSKVPLFPRDHISDKKVMALRNNRKRLQSKLRTMGYMDYSTHNIEKHQPGIGPCRRELDVIVRRMKDMSRVMTRSLYLPNCDKKGFFKRKQCKPSRGRKRGICWCVDKYGIMMPGTDNSRGDIQCKGTESHNNNE